MSVNSVTSNGAESYSSYTSTSRKTAVETKSEESGVIYEPSSDASSSSSSTTAKTYTSNSSIVAQMKADAETNSNQLLNIVKQLMTKQGNAYGQATDMWQFLSGGNYTVDASTKAQAQADISEN